VVIKRKDDGAPDSAEITDYKSNRTSDPQAIDNLVRIYKPQMALYRRALARLLDLSQEKIAVRLFFTVSRKIVQISG